MDIPASYAHHGFLFRPAPHQRNYGNYGDSALNWQAAPTFERLRRAESIGRPFGDHGFLARPETLTHRLLKPSKRGPKPSPPPEGEQGELSALSR